MDRYCKICNRLLSERNPGCICVLCQNKLLPKLGSPENLYYDAEDMAALFVLKNAESVKRKARRGELPPRIPGIRKCLWPKEVIEDWRLSGFKHNVEEDEKSKAILKALELGWPIDQMTYYGHNVGNLISELKSLGHLEDGGQHTEDTE